MPKKQWKSWNNHEKICILPAALLLHFPFDNKASWCKPAKLRRKGTSWPLSTKLSYELDANFFALWYLSFFFDPSDSLISDCNLSGDRDMCASMYLWHVYNVVIWYCKWTIIDDVTEICNPAACLQTFENWSSFKANDPLLIDDLVLETRSMLANTRSTRRLHGQQIEGELLMQSPSRKSLCDLNTP